MDSNFRQNFIQQTVLGGVFYDAVINRPAGQSKKEAVQIAATGFEPFSKNDFETLFGDKYQAADWLAKNKSTLTSVQIYSRLQHSLPINDKHLADLWDNLYYHIILNLPTQYQNSITNLLVVQHIITNLTTGDKIDYMRLANAVVIIPDKIFTEDR